MSRKSHNFGMTEVNYYVLKAFLAEMKDDPDKFHELLEEYIEAEVEMRYQLHHERVEVLDRLAMNEFQARDRLSYLSYMVDSFASIDRYSEEQVKLILAGLVNTGLDNKGFTDLLASITRSTRNSERDE